MSGLELERDLISIMSDLIDMSVPMTPRKCVCPTTLDSKSIKSAYEDVRSDASQTQWAVFKYQDSKISCTARGQSFDKFRAQFRPDERSFGYLRMMTGDEMSRRLKFLLITWVGCEVGVIQRAKVSIDKALVKSVITNFALELQVESLDEVDLDLFQQKLMQCGGAYYGTGEKGI
ncbi:coactosin-like protein [Diaphorina citri]|uniref:Coactosin-like protein n=1 Tax=Diaphorina citri TaxID=121845 RepID=A0A1S3DL65_DIACI|nr:coactosin-like protein [Diaphorina citri]